MRVLALPRSVDVQDLSGSTAQIDDKGRITLGGFVFSETPLLTNLLKFSEGDRYVQLVPDSVLAPSSSNQEAVRLILPSHKNSIPTSRKADWVTPYLKSGYHTRTSSEPGAKPSKDEKETPTKGSSGSLHLHLHSDKFKGERNDSCEPRPTRARMARKTKQ